MEDYIKHIKYNLQTSKQSNLDKDISKTTLIMGMKEKCLDMLNLMGKEDIFKEPCDDIISFFLRSIGAVRNKTLARDVSPRI